LDRSPSIYAHRNVEIYKYKPDEDNNKAGKLIDSLHVSGQQTPITYVVVDGQKKILCGWRRVEALWAAIEAQVDPKLFFPEMELTAVEVESSDPNDLLEISVADNEVREGFTDDEIDVVVKKMFDAGFPVGRVADALGKSPSTITRIRKRLGSPALLKLIKDDFIATTTVDNLIEAAGGDTRKVEEMLTKVKDKVDGHIALKRADAKEHNRKFDDKRDGKFSTYVTPKHTKQWIDDVRENRSVDWKPEPAEKKFELTYDPEKGKITASGLSTLNVPKMSYHDLGQLTGSFHIVAAQIEAEFKKKKEIQAVLDKSAEAKDLSLADYFQQIGATDLAKEVTQRVAAARGEADPGHGNVKRRKTRSVADKIDVPDENEPASEAPAEQAPPECKPETPAKPKPSKVPPGDSGK
jgi:ParB-like chromosome segregation protein Spo0J